MAAALLSINSVFLQPAAPMADQAVDRARHITLIDRDHPDRKSLETFIAGEFFKVYGAHVDHFCDVLVGCTDAQGEWIAALGFSLAHHRITYLEQYLDDPIELAVTRIAGLVVSRSEVVEVGNLAANNAGAARNLIIFMTDYLFRQGLKWVTFTATRELLNSFTRLKLQPIVLAEADPDRLPDHGKSWGSYYASNPQVMFGNIEVGYARLAK